MARQEARIALRGLCTNFNPHEVPAGSLLRCENATIRREGIASKARGMKRYGNQITGPATVLGEFNETIVAVNNQKVVTDDNGAGGWSTRAYVDGSSITAEDPENRVKFREVRSAVLLTTADGVLKLDSIFGTVIKAGLLPPTYAGHSTNTGASVKFLSADSKVSYRAVVVRRDANGFDVYSPPSERFIVSNTDLVSASDATVNFHFVEALKAGDKIEIYRTNEVLNAVDDPSDEHYLAKTVTGSAGQTYLSYNDVEFEVNLDEPLYTNGTQEGIIRENGRPPIARDLDTYRGHTLYLRTRQPARVSIRLNDIDALSVGSAVSVVFAGYTHTFTAVASSPGLKEFILDATGADESTKIELTVDDLVRSINHAATQDATSLFWAQRDNDPESPPGGFEIVAKRPDASSLYVLASSSGVGAGFDPPLTTSVGGAGAVFAVEDRKPNGLYISKFEQPEAVPLVNFEPVGSEASEGLRVLALRDAAIIFKERDGIFRLTGESEASFSIREYDRSTLLIAPDTACVVNNTVMALTNKGVVQIDDVNGVVVISRKIENQIGAASRLSNLASLAHAFAYEAEHEYWLWVPESESDTSATIAFVYNVVTREWYTRRKKCSCAMGHSTRRKAYFGHGEDSYVLEERKDGSLSDYADEDITVTVTATSTTTLSSGEKVSVATVSYGYAGATPAAGWLFTYGVVQTVVVAVVDNGGGSYTLTLSDDISLPAQEIPSSTPGLPGLLGLMFITSSKGSGNVNFSATLSIAIDSTIQFAPFSAGRPMEGKLFSEFQFLFEENFSYSHQVAFPTNLAGAADFLEDALTVSTPGWSSGGWGEIPWEADEKPAIPTRVGIPYGRRRGSWIAPVFRHAVANERWDLVGAAVEMRVSGSTTIKTTS